MIRPSPGTPVFISIRRGTGSRVFAAACGRSTHTSSVAEGDVARRDGAWLATEIVALTARAVFGRSPARVARSRTHSCVVLSSTRGTHNRGDAVRLEELGL